MTKAHSPTLDQINAPASNHQPVNLMHILLIDHEVTQREHLKIELSQYGIIADLATADKLPDILGNQQINSYAGVIVSTDMHSASSILTQVRAVNAKQWLVYFGQMPNPRDKYQLIEEGYDEAIMRSGGVALDDLLAVLSVIRRRTQLDITDGSVLKYADLTMNLISREVHKGSTLIELRSKEFDLLKVFLQNPEEVLSRQVIFNQVWGFDFIGDSNVIEVYIRYLRAKLGKSNLIRTKRGQGYVMITDEAQIQKSGLSF